MTMTRKDLQLISDELKLAQPQPWHDEEGDDRGMGVWRDCCFSMARALRSNNPRFDKDRFLRACGDIDD